MAELLYSQVIIKHESSAFKISWGLIQVSSDSDYRLSRLGSGVGRDCSSNVPLLQGEPILNVLERTELLYCLCKYRKFNSQPVVLGGAFVAGEMVVLEEDHKLSRHGTELWLQIYSHSFANLLVLFVQSELSRRDEIGAELWQQRFWEEGCW